MEFREGPQTAREITTWEVSAEIQDAIDSEAFWVLIFDRAAWPLYRTICAAFYSESTYDDLGLFGFAPQQKDIDVLFVGLLSKRLMSAGQYNSVRREFDVAASSDQELMVMNFSIVTAPRMFEHAVLLSYHLIPGQDDDPARAQPVIWN